MKTPVHKVTCFITRAGKNGLDLLLFNHPIVGVQIPACTVDPGEDPASAACREASKEIRLADLVLKCSPGEADDLPPPGFVLVAYSTPEFTYRNPQLQLSMLPHLVVSTGPT